jgi:hypothetical protein
MAGTSTLPARRRVSRRFPIDRRQRAQSSTYATRAAPSTRNDFAGATASDGTRLPRHGSDEIALSAMDEAAGRHTLPEPRARDDYAVRVRSVGPPQRPPHRGCVRSSAHRRQRWSARAPLATAHLPRPSAGRPRHRPARPSWPHLDRRLRVHPVHVGLPDAADPAHDATRAQALLDHDGAVHYFCSEACLDRFARRVLGITRARVRD